jgi:hypothetical protein
MEYSLQWAVADGVNVGGEMFRIRTRITEKGSTIEKNWWVGRCARARLYTDSGFYWCDEYTVRLGFTTISDFITKMSY